MAADLASPGLIALYIFIASAAYLQYRGKDKLPFLKQLTDHSTIMAPINCFMYIFSAVPNTNFLDTRTFPDLQIFRDNWQTIRDEALQAYRDGYVKSSEKLDDLVLDQVYIDG
jgi:beta-hydroxylase